MFRQLLLSIILVIMKIDLYDLLTIDQKEQVAEIFMEAMTSNNIFPEIWEMSVHALIESHKEFYEPPSK